MRTGTVIATACMAAVLCGCGEQNSATVALQQQVEKLTEEKADLQRQLDDAARNNDRLTGRIQTLTELPSDRRTEQLTQVETISVGRFTGLYDKDEDGTREKLIVYVRPSDVRGDAIKAAGEFDVQLWNLSKPADQALLGEWHVAAEELPDKWYATMMNTSYRLMFDAPEAARTTIDPLTVKVTFLDYLSGKTFTEQTAIELK